MSREQLWVIAYDSPSNKRRRKLAQLLEGYGVRVQWSVFECRLLEKEHQALRERLLTIINPEMDSVRLWPVPEQSCARVVQIGRSVPTNEWIDRVV